MQVLLVPDNNRSGSTTCLTRRQVAIIGVLLVGVLPVVVGMLSYRVGAAIDRLQRPGYLAQLQQSLKAQEREIEAARRANENHLNALALQLGKIQAQMLRVNALGQQLTDMAGLTKGEFDFSQDPGLGGPEAVAALPDVQSAELEKTLKVLAQRVESRHTELSLLEALLMDRQMQAALHPQGWPVVGGYISSRFGYRRDPFNGRRAFHNGVDIANRMGAPVKAIATGVVTHADEKDGYGRMVEINHGNGYTTRYAHVSKISVRVGQKIEKGQEIASVGSSGRSTGPHLHIELLHNGRAINPRKYLRAAR